MLGVRLFPPQVLSDLNFFNVKSEKELASRLRAVQRVAVAIIGTYLMERYKPTLVAKWGSKRTTEIVIHLVFCLSFPSANLMWSRVFGYQGTMYAVSNIRNKEIGWAVINVACVGMAYYLSQIYRNSRFEIGLLEKLFQKVEDRYTQPLYRRFYTQTN